MKNVVPKVIETLVAVTTIGALAVSVGNHVRVVALEKQVQELSIATQVSDHNNVDIRDQIEEELNAIQGALDEVKAKPVEQPTPTVRKSQTVHKQPVQQDPCEGQDPNDCISVIFSN